MVQFWGGVRCQNWKVKSIDCSLLRGVAANAREFIKSKGRALGSGLHHTGVVPHRLNANSTRVPTIKVKNKQVKKFEKSFRMIWIFLLIQQASFLKIARHNVIYKKIWKSLSKSVWFILTPNPSLREHLKTFPIIFNFFLFYLKWKLETENLNSQALYFEINWNF